MKGDARSAPPDALSRFWNTMKIGLTQSTIPFEKKTSRNQIVLILTIWYKADPRLFL